MSTRKLLSQIRKLLSSSDWPAIQQGIILAAGMGMPEVTSVLTSGISVSDAGSIEWARASEVVKRMPSTWRAQAAVDIAARFGLLSSVRVLVIRGENSNDIIDLSALTGLTFTTVDLSRASLLSDDAKDGAAFLQPLSGATSLTTLKLSGNDCALDLAPLKGCTALKTLSLYRCNIVNPGTLASLSALEDLDLSSSSIRSLLPLRALKSLKELSLRYCEVTDLSPLSGLTNLTSFTLPGDGDGVDQAPLRGLTGLATTSEDPSSRWTSLVVAPERFATLTHLDLVSGRYSSQTAHPPSFAPLRHLPALISLHASVAEDTTDLDSLGGLPLQALTLSGGYRKSTISSLKGLLSLPQLRSLTLKKVELSTANLAVLQQLTHLTSLTVTEASLPSLSFLARLTGLTELRMQSCEPSSRGVEWDFSVLRGLHGLRAMAAPDADGAVRLQGLNACLWLWSMADADLSGVRLLKLAGAPQADLAILTKCAHLESLDLSDVQLINADTLSTLRSLKRLDLSGCTHADLSCLIPLAKLEHLDLSGGSSVSVRPSKVVLDNPQDTAEYRLKLARALKRNKNPTDQQAAWLKTLEA